MDLIAQLKRDRRFYGTCPKCGEEFQIRQAVLFRIGDSLPARAIEKIEEIKRAIHERRAEIRRQRSLARDTAAKTTESVNIGMVLEVIAPSFASFMFSPKDCRALFRPIDYLIFPGLSKQHKIETVVFAEIKSGQSRLDPMQRSIRDVVSSGKVAFKTNRRIGV